MYKCEISIPLSEKNSEILYQVILPETISVSEDRAKTKINKDKENLIFNINANDIVALRSALNAYLRYVKLSLDTLEVI